MAKEKSADAKVFDNRAHAERQEALAAQFRGASIPLTEEQAAAEREWQENHEAQQRAAYPHIYRDADERMARDDYQPARASQVPLAARYPVTGAMEPGHDPGLQAATEAADAATAGADNRPPHETTPATPNLAGTEVAK